ncbi:unnamed protein product, partial [Rotaria magnacalcarata]
TFAGKPTYPPGSTPTALQAVDLNGDGKPDIIVANYGSSNVGVLLNIGNGMFAAQAAYPAGASPAAVAAADVNGDGKPDIIVANHGSHNVGVLLNIGKG